MRLIPKKPYWLLTLLIVVSVFLRFYNLNWGSPFYFHPDERNIASAVSQLSFPEQMNPHFFAYGSLPIYAIYFFGLISNFFTSCHMSLVSCPVLFEQAIIISRIFSAVFSVLLIPLVFLIGQKLYGRTAGLITAALATLSVGFIQFAHFGTFEMWLTFCSTLLFYLLIHHKKSIDKGTILLTGLVLGMLVAIKISSLALLPLIILVLLLYDISIYRTFNLKPILRMIGSVLLVVWVAALVYFFTNPYVILDTPSFINSMWYETTLATGELPVFYTQEFRDTIPVLYQLRFVYPFLLNPVISLIFPFALGLSIYTALKNRKQNELLLVGFFLVLFLSQAVLFVKWTRYLVPTLPFLYLIIAGAGYSIFFHKKQLHRLAIVLSSLLILIGAVFSFSYVKTVFSAPDTRISAAAFAESTIPGNAMMLSEVYDLGIIPFNQYFPHITLFNFYDLDNGSPEATPETLMSQLAESDYIILPSPRLYKTRVGQTNQYPKAHAFYSALQSEAGYKKIYETPCDIFCRITYLNDPIFMYEGSANVFDRPTVKLFQKL
jgi:4-amino-4-deoxy-L-arabinose transferase-like glycosyltransferase